MRLLLPVLLALAALLTAPAPFLQAKEAQKLQPYANASGLYGYRTFGGETVIAPRFQLAGDFSEHGIAEVVDEEGWAVIDRQGRVLLRPFIFDNGPDPFSQGLARFVENEKIGFFNQQGQKVIPARVTFAEPFADSVAPFCQGCEKVYYGEHWSMEGGSWGCIDRQGTVLRKAGTVDGPQGCWD